MSQTSGTDFKDGWWRDATPHLSPHAEPRLNTVEIDQIVIHAISLPAGEFGGPHIHALFANTLDCDLHPAFAELRGLRVSAHFLIDRRGLTTQFVSIDERAWHAGVSSFGGRAACNARSIGIELEGCDSTSFAPAQYESLSKLLVALVGRHPRIRASRIVGHADIAPTRKTDPGPHFDWIRCRRDFICGMLSGV
ncbi:MAG: 1,6-anhydro-N-acetylmuramyl-L-alanine amidase AmpD [Gammaproteobacteria bacterium]|nr:1,6-anhydro-N-acetylmuramyl-L-alanine amidase AmpD [Gammaproteobacteria bacterium]